MADDDISVRVAVRIRPQVSSEVIDMCRVCTAVTPGEPQVILGQDKSFTFDYVFDTPTEQEEIFEQCVAGLVRGSLDGYNATVFAYGQTGSGKTYTMGTGFEIEPASESKGIIPRAVEALFNGIHQRREETRSKGLIPPEFTVVAQFMELYNEEVIDLFDHARDNYGKAANRLRIHEDGGGGISVTGVTMKPVKDIKETLACLRHGALARTTAATRMNATSSRSHAVFTLNVKQQRLVRAEKSDDEADASVNPINEFETLSAKFHFVDLAGSERLKRTGATGERAKEGIAINCGLLALGNVISALGDKSKKVTHVPYRDSKLTRLLQDSLGGNSQTVMIACISPSDRDFMETLNTLKYANRARNIKNKIVVNQDKSSRTIALLRQEILQLQTELLEFKQGKRIVSDNGEEGINDMFHENTVLQSELNNLRTRVKAMQGTIDQISQKNTELLSEKAMGAWMHANGNNATDNSMTEIIQGYIKEIEELRAKLMEANITYEMLRKNMTTKQNAMNRSFVVGSDVDLLETSSTVINDAKRELYKERELLAKSKGEMEFHKKHHHNNAANAGLVFGERERAEGESADDSDGSNDGEESDSDDDTDSETKICAQLGSELALLTGDIDTKQRLIEELELSQRRLHSLKRHYEDKLLALNTQIKNTQEERDKVLASYGNQLSQPTDKVKRVKDEYERKLTDMQRELKRLQVFQREHTKMLRSQSSAENKIKTMKNELVDMKRNKVKLLNKMKEESTRHKQTELKRNREIAQLKKESRKNANTIKTLEAERRLKEQVLKRKQEEVTALRKGNKQMMSVKVAGRVAKVFSSRQAKHKWQEFEKVISKVALNKQAIGDLERDMERHLAERETLSKELEILKHRRRRAMRENMDIFDIDNEIDTVKSNIEYLQENIAETQHNIMQFEEAKDGTEDSQLHAVLSNINDIGEARYLLEKLYTVAVNQMYSTTQVDMQLKESQAKLQELHNESVHNESMLRHVLNTTGPGGDFNFDEILVSTPTSPGGKTFILPNKGRNEISSGTSTRSVSPVDSSLIEMVAYNGLKANKRLQLENIDSSVSSADSQVTTPTSEISGSFQRNNNYRGSVRLREIGIFSNNEKNKEPPSIMTQSMGGELESAPTGQPLARVPSAPGSLKGLLPHKALVSTPSSDSNRPSPYLSRKSYTIIQDPFITSPRFTRKMNNNLNTTITLQQPTIGKPSPIEQFGVRGRSGDESISPPRSPGSRRRDINVFCRLTGTCGQYDQPVGGIIKEFTGRGHSKAPLQCVHIAEGHSSAVLSVCATEDLLFSSSADRTVKVWDLTTCREYTTLIGHPNSVVTVRYDPNSRLLFCASLAYVKVWDLRSSPHKAIKTLCSSGSTQSSMIPLAAISRAVHIPPGESQIYDIALNERGTTLYTAASDKVRVWDLRKFESTGKVQSGHTAAVMCLSVGTVNDNDDVVITGSKDHYIKVFEVRNAIGGAVSIPRLNLEPPHYDGVSCLTLSPDLRTLYSGSRDMSIKMWNLDTQELVYAANNAHKNWVTGLALLNSGSPSGGPILVSSCKAGYLQLWDAQSCQSFAQMKTDNFAINAIATNSSQIFTASNDGKVKIWNFNPKFASMPLTPSR